MEDIRYNVNLDLKLHNTGFVSVLRNENYKFEYKNGKERHSFIYVHSGSVEYFFINNKEKICLNKGDFLFVPKNLPYKCTYLKNNTIIKIIVFDISSKKPYINMSQPLRTKMVRITDIYQSISKTNMYSALYLHGKIYEIMHYLRNDSISVPQKYKNILPAVDEIKFKYYENKKVSYYANLCSMSESNFRKLFKEYTGKTFVEYRNLLRLIEVEKLLRSGEFTISEAAYTAGFNNMAFFYEIYNRYMK